MVPWHITSLRIVAQSKPVNYSGAFNSSDQVLTQSWYSGAYGSRYGSRYPHPASQNINIHISPFSTTLSGLWSFHLPGIFFHTLFKLMTLCEIMCRLNMMPYGFNSILMDRGDRVSIQGAHEPGIIALLEPRKIHLYTVTQSRQNTASTTCESFQHGS